MEATRYRARLMPGVRPLTSGRCEGMQGPQCRLINPDTALRCDCGYEFATRSVKTSYVSTASRMTAHMHQTNKRNKHKVLLIIIGLLALATNAVSNLFHFYQRDLTLYFFEQRDSFGFVVQGTIDAMERLTKIVDAGSVFISLLLVFLFFSWMRDFSRSQISRYVGYATAYVALWLYIVLVIIPIRMMRGRVVGQLLVGIFRVSHAADHQ